MISPREWSNFHYPSPLFYLYRSLHNTEVRLLAMTNFRINYSNDLCFLYVHVAIFCIFIEHSIRESSAWRHRKRGRQTLCSINFGTHWHPAFGQTQGTNDYWDGLIVINRNREFLCYSLRKLWKSICVQLVSFFI